MLPCNSILFSAVSVIRLFCSALSAILNSYYSVIKARNHFLQAVLREYQDQFLSSEFALLSASVSREAKSIHPLSPVHTTKVSFVFYIRRSPNRLIVPVTITKIRSLRYFHQQLKTLFRRGIKSFVCLSSVMPEIPAQVHSQP